eukprot:11622984-Heterocapsa_arctica.AAC.1
MKLLRLGVISFLSSMNYMEGKDANFYTIEGWPGTFREHPKEVPGTILESILGLGAIYEEHGFTELEDLPELVVEIEEGLKTCRINFRAHSTRRKDWIWDEYDEIWGFKEVPTNYLDDQTHADALEDRSVRGVPTQIEEQDLDDFNERMERRRISRMRRGVTT